MMQSQLYPFVSMARLNEPDAPRSPYKPGNGLEPPYLGDRAAQLERFREFLADPGTPHNVVVTGLRGVGKTVLLQRYSIEAREAGWLVADREFSEADAEPSMFAQRVLADLTRLTRDLSLSRRVKDAAGGAVDRVTDLLGTLTVSYEGVELGYSPGRRSNKTPKQMLDDDLRDALREVGRLCQKSDHPGFIMQYDEFQVVKEERRELTLSALLAATAAVQREGIPVMLVLCGLPTILENLGRSKSYSERMFAVEQIGHLHPPEDRLALTGPAEARGRRFTDPVVEAVLLDTQGYPFFIQLYGDALWKGTNAHPVIAEDDFRRLRPGIVDGLDRSFFESRYRRASAREQRVLRAMAAGGGEASTIEDLRQRLHMSNSELQPLLRFLVEKGLIYRPTRGHWRLPPQCSARSYAAAAMMQLDANQIASNCIIWITMFHASPQVTMTAHRNRKVDHRPASAPKHAEAIEVQRACRRAP